MQVWHGHNEQRTRGAGKLARRNAFYAVHPTSCGAAGKVARAIAAVLLATTMMVPLTGCRDSDVLTEKIRGAVGQYEIDYSLAPARVESDVAPSSDRSVDENESERASDHEESNPDYDKDEHNSEAETDRQVHDDELKRDGDALEGGSGSEPNSGVGDGGGDSSTPTDASNEGDGSRRGALITINPDAPEINDTLPNDGNSAGENAGSGSDAENTWNPGSAGAGGGEGDNRGQTYNNGSWAELPQDVGKIAAAGPYATIVQSLGGKGALAACNQQWLDDLPTQAYDYHSELDDVVGISSWGDGTTMDDETVQELISAKPDVVLTSDSFGGVVTDEQAKALNDAGIDVVVLPAIGVIDALDEDISTTVAVVGQLLKDAGTDIQFSSVAMAGAWRDLHTRAIEQTLGKAGGYGVGASSALQYFCQWRGIMPPLASDMGPVSGSPLYTTFLDSWSDARYGTDEILKENDWPPLMSNRGTVQHYVHLWPVDEWAVDPKDLVADISDGGGNYPGMSGKAGQSYFILLDYYLQNAGIVDYMMGGQFRTDIAEDSSHSNLLFYAPANWRDYVTWGENAAIVRPVFRSWETNGFVTAFGLQECPGVCVRNKTIAENLQQSARRVDRSSLTVGLYNTGYDYSAYVIPCGVDGSWCDGGFESFLASPYLYGVFHGDLSLSDSLANEFYSTFYRCGSAGILDAGGNYGAGTGCGGYGSVYAIRCAIE